jgi:hypothetical protein
MTKWFHKDGARLFKYAHSNSGDDEIDRKENAVAQDAHFGTCRHKKRLIFAKKIYIVQIAILAKKPG